MAQDYSSFGYVRLYLEWWESGVNTSKNTSVANVKAWLYYPGGQSAYNGYPQTLTIKIAGATVATVKGITYSLSTGSRTKQLGSWSKTITHASNGTGSAAIWGNIDDFSGTTATVSKTLTLTKIARYANITSHTVSINDRTAAISWRADKKVTRWRWSSNNGATYSSYVTVNGTSGSLTVGTSPGTAYNFRVQVIADDSGLTTTSGTLARTATKTASSLTRASSTAIGSGMTWSIQRAYNEYKQKLHYSFGKASGYISGSGGGHEGANNNLSGTWTLPSALANQIPNASSGTGTLTLYTYFGATHIGTKTYTFTATVSAAGAPTATIRATGMSLLGTRYAQNKSRVTLASTGSGSGGSTISSYVVTINGQTLRGASVTTTALRTSGTNTAYLTVTDSRGRTGTANVSIQVDQYSPPSLTNARVFRSTSKGAASDSAAYGTAIMKYSISPVTNQNKKVIRFKTRPSGGAWTTHTVTPTLYSGEEKYTFSADAEKTYEVIMELEDSYETVDSIGRISTQATILDFHASGRGVAIGKVSEKRAFEVDMPTEFRKGIGIPDSRNADESPEWYFLNFPKSTTTEFKVAAEVGLPGVSGYCSVETITRWGDPSGGEVVQTATVDGGGKYTRSGRTTWSTWIKIMKESDMADFVVERGGNRSGNWRKWNSGDLEQWGDAGGSGDGTPYLSIDFKPPITMQSIEVITGTMSGFVNGKPGMLHAIRHLDKLTINARIMLVTGGNIRANESGTLNWHMKGTWK